MRRAGSSSACCRAAHTLTATIGSNGLRLTASSSLCSGFRWTISERRIWPTPAGRTTQTIDLADGERLGTVAIRLAEGRGAQRDDIG